MKARRGRLIPFAASILAAVTLVFASGPVFAEPSPPVIVALGDSLTAGYQLPQAEAFPAQLQEALEARGQKVEVVNAGVSGDTAAGGLSRFDWAVPENADAIILELGANDALRGLSPAEAKASLAKIIEQAKARDLPVLLAGMEAPRNMGKDYVEEFHAIYPALAEQYDLILYPFFLDGVAMDDTLTLSDGMHPNGDGVAKIVDGIMPKVEELLGEVRAQREASAPASPSPKL
ncbi:Arylesterase precursor [Methyloligella halotolerans]|uniref:Arylesterase n=1 Tax=Methyloligella halotolerans TaxID=1177755 RepID=A0A1E2RVN5_9HYPH|nr:arylesterase [Methyloligella halotolerans]ODA66222.1 Arylesterase precursor [Methyloligella halotolerans]